MVLIFEKRSSVLVLKREVQKRSSVLSSLLKREVQSNLSEEEKLDTE